MKILHISLLILALILVITLFYDWLFRNYLIPLSIRIYSMANIKKGKHELRINFHVNKKRYMKERFGYDKKGYDTFLMGFYDLRKNRIFINLPDIREYCRETRKKVIKRICNVIEHEALHHATMEEVNKFYREDSIKFKKQWKEASLSKKMELARETREWFIRDCNNSLRVDEIIVRKLMGG